jgi:four helix bundle protein
LNGSQVEHFKNRTRLFALRVIRLVEALPKGRTAEVLGRQLLRCGTSVGANYRAACRARSKAEFVSRLGVVEEEADEAGYWMQLIVDAGLMKGAKVSALMQEATEIAAMVVASIKTARRRAG